jgi:methyl-accepting chemotaxis protein
MRIKKIQFKFSLLILLNSTLMLLMYAGYSFFTTKDRLEKDLTTSIDIIGSRLCSTLQEPLYNYDNVTIKAILESEMNDRQIVNITIHNPDKKSILMGLQRDSQWKTVPLNNTIDSLTSIYINKEVSITKDKNTLGIASITFTKKYMHQQLGTFIYNIFITIILLDAILFIVTFFSLKIIVLSPLENVIDGLRAISKGEGDLTKRLKKYNNDELGVLSELVNTFIDKLAEIVVNISENATRVSDSAHELNEKSAVIASGTEEVSIQSSNVSSSADTISDNVNGISANAKMMSDAITSIVNSVGEMKESLEEVSENCNKEAQSVALANQRIVLAESAFSKFSVVAENITSVVGLIKGLAYKTNLLALNAKIEAAHAGQAGQGFAIVANEVKELAHQTSEATTRIEKQIQELHQAKDDSIKAFDGFSNVIKDISTITDIIVSAMQEQSNAIALIAGNIQNTQLSANTISGNVYSIGIEITQMTSNLKGISDGTNDNAKGAGTISNITTILAAAAEQLKKLVERFKISNVQN